MTRGGPAGSGVVYHRDWPLPVAGDPAVGHHDPGYMSREIRRFRICLLLYSDPYWLRMRSPTLPPDAPAQVHSLDIDAPILFDN